MEENITHKPYYDHAGVTIYEGHILTVLESMEPESVQMCVTSPPYWGLRDYGLEPQIWDAVDGCEHVWGNHQTGRVSGGGDRPPDNKWKNVAPDGNYDSQSIRSFCLKCGAWRGSLGLEPTPELYVKHLVQVFRGVKRVLRKDGTLWLNIADTMASKPYKPWGVKPKDECGIPDEVIKALRMDGWYRRSTIIWNKPNPMPESVTDRPTKSHEYMFLLTKSAKYYYDAEAIKEDGVYGFTPKPGMYKRLGSANKNPEKTFGSCKDGDGGTRNKRSVWTVATQPYKEAHFATFPTKLIEPCIKAGTSEHGCCSECGSPWERVVEKGELVGKDRGGNYKGRVVDKMVKINPGTPGLSYENKTIGWQPTCKCFGVSAEQTAWDVQMGLEEYNPIPCVVLDPFGGSMTTAYVSKELGRKAVMIDLSKEYIEMGIDRLKQDVFRWKNA